MNPTYSQDSRGGYAVSSNSGYGRSISPGPAPSVHSTSSVSTFSPDPRTSQTAYTYSAVSGSQFSQYSELANASPVRPPTTQSMSFQSAPAANEGSINPIPFIQYEDNGKFTISDQAVRMLQKIQGRVSVVSVAGVYRTGKSYLLNQLAGRQSGRGGFQTGSTVNACTKGIWIWGEPIQTTGHDGRPTQMLLLDTEGIDSLERSEEANVHIFAMALLLSSFFIYNSMHTIDESAIDRISLVAEVTKRIKRFANDRDNENASALAEFFPSFLWLLRDFSLELVDRNGAPITPKAYLESAFRNQPGDSQRTVERNNIRETLRQVFPQRDCFTFVRPVQEEKDLKFMSELPMSGLRPEFLRQLQEFKQTVFRQLRPKMINGQELNGSMLLVMTQTYIEAINNGAVPTIMSAWENVASVACHEALEIIRNLYRQGIRKPFERGVPSSTEFEQLHQSLMSQAQKIFDEKAIGMRKDEFFAKFKAEVMQEYTHLKQTVEKHASENCARILEELWSRLSSSQFAEAEDFSAALKSLFAEYFQRTPNVPAKMDVLQKFLSGSFADVVSKYVKTHESAAKTALAKQKQLKDEYAEKSAQIQSEHASVQQQAQQYELRARQVEEETNRSIMLMRQLEAEQAELGRRSQEYERLRSEHAALAQARGQITNEIRERTSMLVETDQDLLALLQDSDVSDLSYMQEIDEYGGASSATEPQTYSYDNQLYGKKPDDEDDGNDGGEQGGDAGGDVLDPDAVEFNFDGGDGGDTGCDGGDGGGNGGD